MAECVQGKTNCVYCETGIYAKEENVVQGIIESGDKVKVEIEGTYRKTVSDRAMVVTEEGEVRIPLKAGVTLVEKAVPPEPPAGSVIQFDDGAIYVRPNLTLPHHWIPINRSPAVWEEWPKVVVEHGRKWTVWYPPIKITTVPFGQYSYYTTVKS